jgi:HEAT repeat protein
MIDSPELRARRITAWSKEIKDPTTAGVTAMKLEGLGPTAIEPLKEGLKDPNAQVRFFCAESLAYLNDTAGVDVLGETAVHNPIFRIYALAALAAMDQPSSHMKLRSIRTIPFWAWCVCSTSQNRSPTTTNRRTRWRLRLPPRLAAAVPPGTIRLASMLSTRRAPP